MQNSLITIASRGQLFHQLIRTSSTAAKAHEISLKDQDKISTNLYGHHESGHKREKNYATSCLPPDWQAMRFKYPEFLPSIEQNMLFRNKLREKLERRDMLQRRSVIEVPEFYVGSILRVEVSDPYANGKLSKFTGICIQREGQGLRATFALRNVIDGFGVEIRYDIYNPTIRNIEVLKLEKRLDTHLLYLRDALPEYSTVPENMTAIPHEGEVPLNKLLVKMKPRPWGYKWERFDFKGIEKMEDIPEYMYNKHRDPKKGFHTKVKYDLLVQYRKHIHEDDQYAIWKDVAEHEKSVVDIRRDERRKRLSKSLI